MNLNLNKILGANSTLLTYNMHPKTELLLTIPLIIENADIVIFYFSLNHVLHIHSIAQNNQNQNNQNQNNQEQCL